MKEATQEEIDKIELRTEEVQEILGTPPHWLVRWGIFLIFVSVMSLLAVSWFVQYPDIVRAPITITTQNPPVKVVAATAGNLNRLLVKDKENVEANQRLAILKSVANAEEVFDLEKKLKQLKDFQPDSLSIFNFNPTQNLGELQSYYADFVQFLEDYQLFLAQQTSLKKIPFLKQEIAYYQNLNTALLSKDSVLQDEIKVAESQYQRQKKVLEIGGTTITEVDKQQSALLQYQREQKNTGVNILNNEILINKLQSEISFIRQQTQELGKSKFILAKESFLSLQSQLNAWLQNYVLVAPIAGQVSFHNYWSEQQFVPANTEVMTIVPEAFDLVGRVFLAIEGSGKVEENQVVNIKLASFPYREYGMLKGKVKKIALAPLNEQYMVEIELENGLTSTYNKTLVFRQEMSGTAEIITKKRRLLERVLETFIIEN